MLVEYFLLALFWLLFSFFHSFFATEKWKKSIQGFIKGNYKYYRIFYSSFSLISLIAVISYHFNMTTIVLWNVQPIELFFAATVIITSTVIILFFAKKFFFELSGADIFLRTNKTGNLINTSFYKHVRHPLYTATLLFIWGIFFWQPSLSNLISCVCITVYTIIGIRFEEKKLIRDFGESYIEYRSKTPMLFPKLGSLLKSHK